MNSSKIQAIFDVLIDGFDPTDEIALEDTYAEMHKYWKVFLEEGQDVEGIVRMMSPEDVFYNYDDLVSFGAVIDIGDLAKDLHDYLFIEGRSNGFFAENYEWFLNRGLDITDLVEYIREVVDYYGIVDCSAARDFVYENREALLKYGISNKILSEIILDCWEDEEYVLLDVEAIEEYLDNGMDVDLLMKMLEDRIPKEWESFENRMLEVCTLLHNHGVDCATIEGLLDKIDWAYTFYRMIAIESSDWEAIGVDCGRYADKYALHYYDKDGYVDLFNNISEELRKHVAKAIVGQFSTRELVELDDDLTRMVGYLVKYGVSSRELGKKFINEVGYDNAGWLMCWYMICLLEQDKSALDLEKVIQEVAKLDSEYGRSYFHGALRRLGVDEAKLASYSIKPMV